MEEVWKDINLASLNDQNTRPITTRSTFGGVILQDFLARPFTIDPPQNLLQSPPNSSSYSSASASAASSESAPLYCPASKTTPPHLVTALSLNSHPDFHFDPIRHKGTSTNSSSQLLVQQQPHHHNASKVVTCFSNNPSSQFESLVPCFGGNKRFAEPPSDSSNSLGDRRNKRMIKNRESAARSRARKQAYTNELEQKVEHLMEENARLKRQQQELWEAASGQQKKKSSLYRTSTAPF